MTHASDLLKHQQFLYQRNIELHQGFDTAMTALALAQVEPRMLVAAIAPAIEVGVATLRIDLEVIKFNRSVNSKSIIT